MDEPTKTTSKQKRKLKHGLIPEKLKSNNLKDLLQSVALLSNTVQNGKTNKSQLTTERMLKILVRGLGSSNIQVQKNYFAALVSLMSSNKTSDLSATKILETAKSELYITGNAAKGEEGEILVGRVLCFGVLVRSGALTASSENVQSTAVTQLLQDIKGKSYLPLIADPFLIGYLQQLNESVFRKAVWPVLQDSVAPGPSQSLLLYHVLLVCEERFPSIVSSKFLKKTLTTPKVLSAATMPSLLSALKVDFKLKMSNHPIYSDIFKYICNADEEVLETFWNEVEKQLLLDSSAVSNKQILAIKFFSLLVSQLENASQVLKFLTPKLLNCFMKKHKATGTFQKLLNVVCREALDNLYKLASKAEDSKLLLSIIKKLLFDPGSIEFEVLSGSKVVQQMMNHLSEKRVKKLAAMFRDVVTGNSSTTEHKDSETVSRPWYNKEKLLTIHMFCRLLSLPAVKTNAEWRLQQLVFLFDLGFFASSNISIELAGLIRESFFSCLSHKLSNLAELRNMLAGIVEHINKRLDGGDQLRIKCPAEVMPSWKKMYETANIVQEDKKLKKEELVPLVFQTMFFHIGLHLFKEPVFATDVLQELHSVYERVGSSDSSEEEPHWTEVVVEMFLSLLSRNSQLHRHFVGCIFSHFCPIMMPQSIHQILQVLDPSSDTNPLLNTLDEDSESSSEDGDVEEEVDEEPDVESSDDGMTDVEEDEEEEDEKVNDKLRRAVIDALGDTGAMTDVESVDLEDMDEEEAARVDKALSQAFKSIKPLKSKKQSSHAKALTHFRIRVLDLIEVWLISEPSLDLMVDTLVRLISLLEHSVVDRHQAPLETRIRSIIKKFTTFKKFNTSDCKNLYLGDILNSLVPKGSRTTTVYMSITKELAACTLFITRASQHVVEVENEEDTTHVTVYCALKDIVNSFFLQRECLLTEALFEGLFRLYVPLIANLASKLPSYAFDPNVNPFRRSKALQFLITFWKNNRLLQEKNEDASVLARKMSKRLYKSCVKMMEEPFARIQPKYLYLLKRAFEITNQKKWITDLDWSDFFQSLEVFKKAVLQKPRKEKKVDSHGVNGSTETMDIEYNGNDSDGNDSEVELEGLDNKVIAKESFPDKAENSVSKEEDEENEQSTAEEESGNDSEDSPEKNTARSVIKKGNSIKSDDTNQRVQNEEEDSASELEDPPTKQIKKKNKKKRSHEKIKETQLLKNKSKRLRLESMAAGLEENVFSKYQMLLNQKSPDR